MNRHKQKKKKKVGGDIVKNEDFIELVFLFFWIGIFKMFDITIKNRAYLHNLAINAILKVLETVNIYYSWEYKLNQVNFFLKHISSCFYCVYV